MKNLLLIAGLMIMGFNVHAGIDKGNGGSGNEALLIAQQSQLETVALKIRTFFLKNTATLKSEFPEFDIQTLAQKIKSSDIQVVDAETLIDKDGVSRTCLNYPDSSLIECKSAGIDALLDQPSTLFVLVFHEYLGLIEVEETSAGHTNVVDGYSISRRIAPYVSKVNDYDLTITAKGKTIPEVIELVSEKFADSNICKGDFLTRGNPKCTKVSLVLCATKNLQLSSLNENGKVIKTFSDDLMSINEDEKVNAYAKGFSSCVQENSLTLMIPINKWIK